MEQEVHIAGVVVYAQPALLDSVLSCIGEIPGADVHGTDASGKAVITLETDSARRAVDYMDAMRSLPGVLNVALVYQHAEPLAAIDQEVSQ